MLKDFSFRNMLIQQIINWMPFQKGFPQVIQLIYQRKGSIDDVILCHLDSLSVIDKLVFCFGRQACGRNSIIAAFVCFPTS